VTKSRRKVLGGGEFMAGMVQTRRYKIVVGKLEWERNLDVDGRNILKLTLHKYVVRGRYEFVHIRIVQSGVLL
jgi:hypothetical protein